MVPLDLDELLSGFDFSGLDIPDWITEIEADGVVRNPVVSDWIAATAFDGIPSGGFSLDGLAGTPLPNVGLGIGGLGTGFGGQFSDGPTDDLWGSIAEGLGLVLEGGLWGQQSRNGSSGWPSIPNIVWRGGSPTPPAAPSTPPAPSAPTTPANPTNPNGGNNDWNDYLPWLSALGGTGGDGMWDWLENGVDWLKDNGSNILSSTIDAGVNFYGDQYMADAFRDSNRDLLQFQQDRYGQDVARLDPYNQLGIRNIDPLQDAARSNPAPRNMFAGQFNVNPNTNVQGPQAGALPTPERVNVNQIDVLAANNPFYQAAVAEGSRAIENSAAARGKLNSGETLDALNRSAQAQYLNFVPTLQSVSSARDQAELASNNQFYGQQMGVQDQNFGQQLAGAGFNLDQQRGNIANQMNRNNQLFNQFLQANQFDQSADINAYNQLSGLVGGIGQPSAAGQANIGQNFMTAGSGVFENQAAANYGTAGRNVGNLQNYLYEIFG